jgi:hypothetical protein
MTFHPPVSTPALNGAGSKDGNVLDKIALVIRFLEGDLDGKSACEGIAKQGQFGEPAVDLSKVAIKVLYEQGVRHIPGMDGYENHLHPSVITCLDRTD